MSEEDAPPIACPPSSTSSEESVVVCKPSELDEKYVRESTEKSLLRADYKFTTKRIIFDLHSDEYDFDVPNKSDE